MSLQIFPVSVTSSTPQSFSSTIATAGLQHKTINPLSAGIYTITTSSSGSQATITFFDSTGAATLIAGPTVNGTLTYNLASAQSGYYIQTTTGSNIIVTVALTGNSVTGTQLSGTLDTITSSGAYNQTGLLYVLACGGGAGGSGTGSGSQGGGAGSINAAFVSTNSATTITIGTGGAGGNANTAGAAGGTTSFGNLVTASGGNSAGGGGVNNTRNANGGIGSVISGSITNSTNAGGTGGGQNGQGNNIAGAVGGFGTGGTGGDGGSGNCQAGGAASGRGAGGGGAGVGNAAQAGGAGSAGQVLVLRGI